MHKNMRKITDTIDTKMQSEVSGCKSEALKGDGVKSLALYLEKSITEKFWTFFIA